mgnify:CR=1 FL=1
MNPNNSPPQPQLPQNLPSGQFNSNQFDFIMNPQKPQKPSLLPGGPKIKMVILGLGIVTVVIVLLAIILGVFSSGDATTEALVKISQQQTEIIRIATDGNKKAGSEKTRKLASMTSMTIATDQQNMLSYLAKQKRKVKPKELNLLVDKKTDTKLAAASSNGRYDEVFTQILLEQLTQYQTALKSNFNSVGDKGKDVLNKSYDNVTLIINDNKTTP